MEKSIDKKGILGSAGVLALAAMLVKIIGLIYKVPLSHFLGDEGMGYFNSAYTIYSFLYLISSAGVPKAITLLVSARMANEDAEGAWCVYLAARRFFLALGVALFILLLFFARPIATFIGSPRAVTTVLLISPCLIFASVGGVYRGYLGAKENFAPSAVASVLEGAMKLFLGLGFVFLGEYYSLSLPHLSAISVLGITFGTLVGTLYLQSNIKIPRNIMRQKCLLKRKTEIKAVLKIALPITLGSAAAGASSLVDLSMIMRRLEANGMSAETATAVYGNYTTLAVPMLQLVTSLLSPFAMVLLPRLSALRSGEREGDYNSILHFGMRAVAFFSVPISAIFFFFSRPLLSLVFPYESAVSAAPLLRLLSSGVLLISALFIVNTALESSGKVHIQMLSMLIGIAAKIPITYILLGNPSVGIAAAPIGTVVSYAVSLAFSCLFLRRTTSFVSLIEAHVLPFFNASVASLSAIFVLNLLNNGKDYKIVTLLVFFVFSLVYLVFSFVAGSFHHIKNKICQNN